MLVINIGPLFVSVVWTLPIVGPEMYIDRLTAHVSIASTVSRNIGVVVLPITLPIWYATYFLTLLFPDLYKIINRYQDQIEGQSPAVKAVSIIDGYKDMCDELIYDRDQVLFELEGELERNEIMKNKINHNEVRYLSFLSILRLMSCIFFRPNTIPS
jgi:hypothetical protein